MLILLAGCGGPLRVIGNQAISERELLAVAHRPTEAWKQSHHPADLADAAEAMRSAYADYGYADAQVEFSVGKTRSRPSARFMVNEGVRIAVGRLAFPGGDHLDKPMREVVDETLRPWYVADVVDAVAVTIEQEYRRFGYMTARVGDPQLTWSADRARVDIDIPIHEGPCFKVGVERIEFIGDAPPGASIALAGLLDPPGTVYDPRLGVRTAAGLRGWLAARGYIFTTVEVSNRIDMQTATAAPVFRVTPRTLHRLGVLSITFNAGSAGKRTATGFVTSRLKGFVPGKPINQGVVDAARNSLYSTGLFTDVTMTPSASPSGAPGVTDLAVVLSESKTRRIDLSAGYGSYEQLRGGIEYVDDHLFGQGLRLHGGVNGSLKGWGADLGLADPFRFGPGRTVGVESAYREREEPSFSHREFTTTLEAVQRFRPSFDDGRWEVRGQYEYKLAEDFTVDGALPTSEITGFYRSSTVTGRIRRDSRGPRVIDPQRGMLAQLSGGWNADVLGADAPYTELGGDWSGYVRLLRRLTGSVHIGCLVRNPTDDHTLPIGERLFLGGEDTVRSFTKDQLGPSDANGNVVGGLSSGVANAELRWRPWRSWPNLELAGFYDVGAIGQRPWTLDAPPGQAIGGGLRYITPVGPIRLDMAYNPGERFAANDVYAIHLAVGFAF